MPKFYDLAVSKWYFVGHFSAHTLKDVSLIQKQNVKKCKIYLHVSIFNMLPRTGSANSYSETCIKWPLNLVASQDRWFFTTETLKTEPSKWRNSCAFGKTFPDWLDIFHYICVWPACDMQGSAYTIFFTCMTFRMMPFSPAASIEYRGKLGSNPLA